MRNIATKVDAVDNLSAAEFNSDQNELENIVTSTDQSLDPAGGADTDLNMLARAVAGYAGAGWAYQDSGSANAYVLSIATNLKPVTKYFDNLMVAFKPGNNNTGASTVNVEGLGVKDIKIAGADPLAGQISTSNIVILKYNNSAGYFEAVSGIGEVKPAFSVHRNNVNQSIPDDTWTKVEFTTEEFDTNNNFDVTTNHRFTPTVARKYLFSATTRFIAGIDQKFLAIALRKNGTTVHNFYSRFSGILPTSVSITAIVDANGTGDYFEVFVSQDTGVSQNIDGDSFVSYFTGCAID